MTAAEATSVFALGMICAAAAWSDWRFRRLPNAFCLVAASLGLFQLLYLSGTYAALSALVHSALALTFGAGLYACGGIGGGDIKFYSAMACWFPLRHATHLLAAVSVSGFILAAVWLLIGQSHRSPEVARDGIDPAMVPFGVAIAAGSIVTSLALMA